MSSISQYNQAHAAHMWATTKTASGPCLEAKRATVKEDAAEVEFCSTATSGYAGLERTRDFLQSNCTVGRRCGDSSLSRDIALPRGPGDDVVLRLGLGQTDAFVS